MEKVKKYCQVCGANVSSWDTHKFFEIHLVLCKKCSKKKRFITTIAEFYVNLLSELKKEIKTCSIKLRNDKTTKEVLDGLIIRLLNKADQLQNYLLKYLVEERRN